MQLPERPHILLVEDALPMAMLIQSMLKKDYHVTLVHNGIDAHRSLQQHDYQLVLCDIGLPDINGIELRQRLEQDSNLRSLPFIFLTANDDNDIAQQANGLGIDDYVRKPVKKQDLLGCVQRALTRNHQLVESIGYQIGEEATERLAPRLPAAINGLTTDLLFHEASAGGGDMVLHIPRTDDDIIIFADVTGHGVKAKYFAHLYTGYLYGLLKHLHSKDTPDALMASLNNMIDADEYLHGNFLTCMILSLRGHEITFCNAGHPAPILFNNTGSHAFSQTSPMVGLLANTEYHTDTITLNAGETLLCVSDGLLEGNRDAIACESFYQWLCEQSPTLTTQTIWHAYQSHFGTTCHDDVTAFMLLPR